MGLYFSSDLHLGDPRLEIFSRDLYFDSVDDMNKIIINNFNYVLSEEDTLVIVGDVCYDVKYVDLIDDIKCKEKILIIGNYDEDKIDILEPYFINIKYENYFQIEYKENDYFGVFITHKPVDLIRAKQTSHVKETIELGICGHIHALWKVKKYPFPMVNVSCDIWNFKPISLERIFDQYHAILNYYDENVFFEDIF